MIDINNVIFSLVNSFEPKRKKSLCRMIITEIVLVIIPVVYYINNGFKFEFDFWGILVLLDILVALFQPYIADALFKDTLKESIMPKAVNLIGNMGHCYSKQIFSDEELRQSTLFGMFNTVETDDSFCGSYSGVKFRISETELAMRGRKGTYFPAFKGVIVRFDSNKKVNAKTTVTTTGDINSKNKFSLNILVYFVVLCLIGPITLAKPLFRLLSTPWWLGTEIVILLIALIFLSMVIPFVILIVILNKNYQGHFDTNKKMITLEDPKFAKCFKVYSEDETEARYLVTTAFMERMLNFTTVFGTNNLKCAFFDDKIMFAISTKKDLFEFGSLYTPLTNPENISFVREIMSILDMIEYFKLNEKTGL